MEHHTPFQEMTHISLRLLSNKFHARVLLYYCALYVAFQSLNKICFNQQQQKIDQVLGQYNNISSLVASAAICAKVVVLLLLIIYCFSHCGLFVFCNSMHQST